ncbi:LytR C-terminal domain-containing protein [Corynebacterium frankenforstense]|uniref:LytR C-terminal domain-containing protein n=1 Tax=Corynebacterium frankenforstense TaxID=1230998 RepID=UPI0012EC9132|nr:LytR C-terminal domain-containing protein [Corynebacterium frankenforstense]
MTDVNGNGGRRDGNHDYDDVYDDAHEGQPEAAAGAHEAPERGEARAAGAGVGATGAGAAGSGAAARSGLPLRGLAMVLIAVAVLLGLWGVYALTSGGDDEASDSAAMSGSAEPGAGQGQAGQKGQAGQNGANGQNGRGGEDAAGERAGQDAGDKQHKDGEADGRTAEGQAGANGAAGHGDAAPAKVNVLNNSTVPDLAARLSDELKGQGTEVGSVGNLPGEVLQVPENTVFFQPGNADAEKRARELADRVGGVAREYDQALPDDTAGANDLTLVLANDVAL